MIHVRKHFRITASGKPASVRAHEREGGDGMVPVPEWSRPAFVGDMPEAAETTEATEDWWADEPVADDGEMSPAFAAMVAQNPELGGESHRRLKALRDSGYDGWVDQDGNPVEA